MAREDRDRLFEKALAQHLRADAAAARVSMCVDAEMLAAYHERQLSAEEMTAIESHILSCLRCQEIVAQLEATRDLDKLPGAEGEAAVTRATPAVRNSDWIAKGSAAAAGSKPVAEIPTKGKVARFPVQRSSLLRWAAPAGAVAAGLLLWVGMRDFRAQRQPAEERTQVAGNRAEASRDSRNNHAVLQQPQLSAKEKTDSFGRTAQEEQNSPVLGSAPGGHAESRRYDALRDEAPSSKPAARALDGASADKKAAAPSAMPVPSPPESERQTGGGVSGESDAGKLRKKTENAERATGRSTLDSAQAVNGQTNQGQQDVAGGTPLPPKGPTQQAAGPPVQPSSQTVAVEAQAQSVQKDGDLAVMSRDVSNLALLSFLASAENGKNVWRFGERGFIVHSSDGGKTWKSQSAGVSVTLTSGSAPSKKICWIAGAAGTLLRTEDGGKHWQLVATPISADLGGVQATDAKHASIWDADRRLSYETFDSGATWRKIDKE
jgi:Photosynthesis system II assembly factor YCF48